MIPQVIGPPSMNDEISHPDGNGIELYRDRPPEEWPRQTDGGGVAMVTAPLDLRDLLSELDRSS